jgi:hypothetical protein
MADARAEMSRQRTGMRLEVVAGLPQREQDQQARAMQLYRAQEELIGVVMSILIQISVTHNPKMKRSGRFRAVSPCRHTVGLAMRLVLAIALLWSLAEASDRCLSGWTFSTSSGRGESRAAPACVPPPKKKATRRRFLLHLPRCGQWDYLGWGALCLQEPFPLL